MKVKICGITDLVTAMKAVEYGADALGFVFAQSKRKIDPISAKEIIHKLPKNVLKVGVFVNESKEVIHHIIDSCKLDLVQLHGEETSEYCKEFGKKSMKAMGIRSEHDLERVGHFPCEYILLDSPKGKYYGGNGRTFDWSFISQQHLHNKKIILAGGLNEQNVKQAISTVQPYMVDVSSGVETNGKKDIAKIKKFIETVKS
ncbi:phosphoribosylanthranilate isomerase [Bacillus aquiflavi]|uniref:N-(5'-phosphoribosyl)anthranilate isomerase n=1 Tax=Bacillus aquiflavi TaxID=2672567 RepID=A0A6B3VWI8_9BACI|nr:phosphoribosylanthranilate isomerase [Bacillus aquiflavi]MBA4537154.1 phosphoribosylanthranilate isomerase [Bacillus aquiflavi]NEY82429.1 phosphoribosylanthranilate isomerase [Bacillus aquiflavi]UAC49778.1 phosphoribosylanthranilate isomerase [Bacillus aquiflavi]